MVRVIKKQLVKRALDMLKEVAERPSVEGKPSDYNTLWESFGKYIKLGAIEDNANKCARRTRCSEGCAGLCCSLCIEGCADKHVHCMILRVGLASAELLLVWRHARKCKLATLLFKQA